MLLYTEYSLLTLLARQKGVIHCRDFFQVYTLSEHVWSHTALVISLKLYLLQDRAYEESDTYGELGKIDLTGRKVVRYCLVLDCLVAHDCR